MPATYPLTEYPRHPSHPNDYCRFAAEWIRVRVSQYKRANATREPDAHDFAARAFRRAYPAIAREVSERLGSYPSSEREFRALQSTQ